MGRTGRINSRKAVSLTSGDKTISGALQINTNLNVSGTTTLNNNTTLNSTLNVSGITTLSNNTSIDRKLTFKSDME